jgi:hypothetical protein
VLQLRQILIDTGVSEQVLDASPAFHLPGRNWAEAYVRMYRDQGLSDAEILDQIGVGHADLEFIGDQIGVGIPIKHALTLDELRAEIERELGGGE